jgi:hypothetical protein
MISTISFQYSQHNALAFLLHHGKNLKEGPADELFRKRNAKEFVAILGTQQFCIIARNVLRI